MCKLSDQASVPAGWKLSCQISNIDVNSGDQACSLFTSPDGRTFKSLEEVHKQQQMQAPLARKYSNDMKDAVCTICQICYKVFKFVAMRGHTKKNHGLTIMAYREKYGKLVPLEEIFHKCGLCGHEMILDSDNVMIHLKQSHNITHANYNAEFMVTARGRPKVERQGAVPGVVSIENSSKETGLHKTIKSAKNILLTERAKADEKTNIFDHDRSETQPKRKRPLESNLHTEDPSSKQLKISPHKSVLAVNKGTRVKDEQDKDLVVGSLENENRKREKIITMSEEGSVVSPTATSEDGNSNDEETEENALIDLMMADNHLTKDEEVDMQKELASKLAMEVKLARKQASRAKRSEEVALE